MSNLYSSGEGVIRMKRLSMGGRRGVRTRAFHRVEVWIGLFVSLTPSSSVRFNCVQRPAILYSYQYIYLWLSRLPFTISYQIPPVSSHLTSHNSKIINIFYSVVMRQAQWNTTLRNSQSVSLKKHHSVQQCQLKLCKWPFLFSGSTGIKVLFSVSSHDTRC